MSIDLSFDGSTECRGRNRWFQLREAWLNVGLHHPWDAPAYPRATVWLQSKKRGKIAPIVLTFHNPEELRTLICGLSKAYAQMITKEESTSCG